MRNPFAIIVVLIVSTYGINNGDIPIDFISLESKLLLAMVMPDHSFEEQCRIYQELLECAKTEIKGYDFLYWSSFCDRQNKEGFKDLYAKCVQLWSTNESLADIIEASAQSHTHPCQEVLDRPTRAPFTFPSPKPIIITFPPHHHTPKPDVSSPKTRKPGVYHPITPKPDKREPGEDHTKRTETPEENDCN